MGTIKYKYALNGEGEKIKISDVTPEIRKATRFTCISCGNELVACLKEDKKQRHFRHKAQVDCNPETYLHEMGKYTFIKTYKECLVQGKPFIISLKRRVSCVKETNCSVKHRYGCWDYKTEPFDLTQYYDVITEEKTIASFRADVLLESSKGHQPILIEIKVSHACSEAKLDSGRPIIEIELNKEEDLVLIESCHLCDKWEEHGDHFRPRRGKHEDPIVKFYNFRESKKKLLNYFKIHQFAVYRNNPSHFSLNETAPCGEKDELIRRHRNENKLLYEILFFNEGLWGADRFVFGVAKAFESGIQIRNCFLCRYHAINENRLTIVDDLPIFCKIYKQLQTNPRCHSTQATNCNAFIPDKKAYEPYLTFFDEFEEVFY